MDSSLEILITNDDGYRARGIRTLARIMSRFGRVTVVAPEAGQSGKSTALTIDTPLHFRDTGTEDGIRYCCVDGTPADCVKMAVFELFPERLPGLLVSGINHGSNASAAAVYSGTLGACQEGTLYGIPSIGFSLDTHRPDADFSAVESLAPRLVSYFLEHPVPAGTYLNINFPDLPADRIRGIRAARQGAGQWIREFEKRTDPHGRPYYWMSGLFNNLDRSGTDADHLLVKEGYVTVVPHRLDTTDYETMEAIRNVCDII